MGKIAYVPNVNAYRNHYGGALPVFRAYEQRGAGFFGNLLRSALPLVKSGAKKLLTSGLKTGANILSDVVSGEKNFETALRDRGSEALTDIKKSVVNRIGSHNKTSKTSSRKRKKQASTTRPPTKKSKKNINKQRDIFTK